MREKKFTKLFSFCNLARADCVGGEYIPDIIEMYQQELQSYFATLGSNGRPNGRPKEWHYYWYNPPIPHTHPPDDLSFSFCNLARADCVG